MRPDRLMDAIGKIDAAYVEEAELWRQKSRQKRFRGYSRLVAAAACLLLVVGGVFAVLSQIGPEGALSGSEENMSGGMQNGQDAASGGMQNGQDAASGGNGYTARERGIEIPEEITEVTVTHWKDGTESTFIIEGTALTDLRQWVDGLVLADPVSFAEGEAPGENGQDTFSEDETGELFFFRFGETEFSYRNYGDHYIVVNDLWYLVRNPTEPPVVSMVD